MTHHRIAGYTNSASRIFIAFLKEADAALAYGRKNRAIEMLQGALVVLNTFELQADLVLSEHSGYYPQDKRTHEMLAAAIRKFKEDE